jgi:hypothetical protein
VALNSDSRSDVEGLRWIITKRAIAALFICALMVLCSLKYASTMQQWQEEERKRFAAMNHGGYGDGGGGERRNLRMQEAVNADEILTSQGDNPALVTLG